MSFEEENLVDWADFESARAELGANFARILQYFQEDGVKSVSVIERAMRERNSAALVVPAHTLKGEALQFGARELSELAETIEHRARHLVETQETPDELLPEVAKLRPMFERTLDMLQKAVNPLVERRRASFGEKVAANQKFGRI